MTRPKILAIAGSSCSGKSTLARALCSELDDAALLSLDSYYLDRSDLDPQVADRLNFDHPEALEFELLREHLAMTREGRPIQPPSYDFASHRRRGVQGALAPRRWLLIEGLHVLSEHIPREWIDVAVFVEADRNLRLKRRHRRDGRERGRTPASIDRQFEETVEPMNEAFVQPTRARADLCVDGSQRIEITLSKVLRHLAHRDLIERWRPSSISSERHLRDDERRPLSSPPKGNPGAA